MILRNLSLGNFPTQTFTIELKREGLDMVCPEQVSLLTSYQKAVRGYTEAVCRMKDHVRGIPQAEFMLLWKFAERAKEKCESAQRCLQKHIAEHGCGRGPERDATGLKLPTQSAA